MKLCEDDAYITYPSYGTAYQDMTPWIQEWMRELPDDFRFWPGFNGGGVLAISRHVPEKQRWTLARGNQGLKPVYGTVLGNEAGQQLANLVGCAQEHPVPALAIKFGLAKKVPDPTVSVTVEHAGSLGDQCVLLVVPEAKRKKALSRIEELPKWFAKFGVELDPEPITTSPAFREEIAGWFDAPTRPMLAYRLQGGEDNAAWQMAVAYYIAEYWDTQTRGLDTVHFVASIEGQPCYRRNWTSNR
jgi:hypothetical protein